MTTRSGNPTRTLRRALSILGAAAIFALGAPTAHAQFRFGQMGMGGAQSISADDLKVYEKVLGLDAAQTEAAEALHGAYAADRDKAEKGMRDQMRKLRDEYEDSRDPGVWQNKMPEIMTAYTKQTADLDKSFTGDLKSLLRADQSGAWSNFERTHRRRQAAPNGMLAGESMDLVSIIDSLNMPKPPSEVSDTLERYSSELDNALQERTRQREELGKQMQSTSRPPGGGMPDFQAMEKVGADMRKAGLKVRDINDRYSAMLRAELPADKQPDFDTRIKKARYPSVYNDSHTLKSLDAAAKFNDLNDQQKTGIKDVRESYLRDLEGANDRLAQQINKAEADGGGENMFGPMSRWMGGGQGEPESDLVKARKAKRDLDRQALDKLKALLNEDQVDRLPERDEQGPGAPRGRGGDTGGSGGGRTGGGGGGGGGGGTGGGRNTGGRGGGSR